MLKKIIYIGSYAHHTLHQMFDTCLLDICTRISNHVECYKHPSTFEYLKDSANKYGYANKIILHELFVYDSKGRWGELIKNFVGAWQNLKMYFKADDDALLIYSNNNVFSLHFINILNRILKRKTLIVCHGELELLKSNSGGLLAKLQRCLLKDFFVNRRISSSLYFIVLGDSIKQNLVHYVSSNNYNHFLSIDHPYYFPIHCTNINHDKRLNFGTVGTLSIAKGLFSFMKLVSTSNANLSYSIIGRIPTNEYNDFMEKHKVRITNRYLTRKELEYEISQLSYVLYFYPQDTYSLIASGAIFDAMCLNKPIIALCNDYFNYILKKSSYPMMLFDSVDDMISYINKGNFSELYNKNFSLGKNIFSPKTVAEDLYTELKLINFIS